MSMTLSLAVRSLFPLVLVVVLAAPHAARADELIAGPFAEPPPPLVVVEPVAPPAPVAPVAPVQVVSRPRRSVHEELARLPFRGGVSLGIGGQGAPGRPLIGAELGLYAIALDRLQLGLKLNGFADASHPQLKDPVLEKKTPRLQVGVETGYRLRLARSFAAYFIPTVGILATGDMTETKLGVQKDGRLFTATEKSTRWAATPTVGSSLQLGWFDLSYRYQFDLKDSRLNTHGVSVGLRF